LAPSQCGFSGDGPGSLAWQRVRRTGGRQRAISDQLLCQSAAHRASAVRVRSSRAAARWPHRSDSCAPRSKPACRWTSHYPGCRTPGCDVRFPAFPLPSFSASSCRPSIRSVLARSLLKERVFGFRGPETRRRVSCVSRCRAAEKKLLATIRKLEHLIFMGRAPLLELCPDGHPCSTGRFSDSQTCDHKP
jgi:hypothetical protein